MRRIWEVNAGATQPLGHEQATVGTSVTTLAPPAGTRRVTFRTLGQPINFTDDGTDPTDATGFPLLADEVMVHDVDEPQAIKLIRSSEATADADVRVMYHGNG